MKPKTRREIVLYRADEKKPSGELIVRPWSGKLDTSPEELAEFIRQLVRAIDDEVGLKKVLLSAADGRILVGKIGVVRYSKNMEPISIIVKTPEEHRFEVNLTSAPPVVTALT